MEVALIRHARPGRWEGSGPADPQLDDAGRVQAEQLVDHLTAPFAPSFAGVYSSTMTRAVETAIPLANKLDLPLSTDPGLVEYDHGLSFYIRTEEIEGGFEQYWADIQTGLYAGRQIDVAGFQNRVVEAVEQVIDAHDDQDRVAIVCHGGVISAFLASVLGNSQPFFFEPDYTSISRVQVSPGGRRHVVSVNETPHLGFSAWDLTPA